MDVREEFLKQNKQSVWEAKIPVTHWLDKGKYSVYMRLENLSGDQQIEKLLPLKM